LVNALSSPSGPVNATPLAHACRTSSRACLEGGLTSVSVWVMSTLPAGPWLGGWSKLHRSSDRTPKNGDAHLRMLMARAMTRAVVDNAMALCSVMSSFAHRVNGIVSVGEKAVALVKLTYM
jgi:hypothetical protein